MKTVERYLPARFFTGLLVILAGSAMLLSSPLKAQMVIPDTTRFLIGSQIVVALEFETGRGNIVAWPEFTDTLSRSIEIISKNKPDTVKSVDGNKITIRQALTITSFDTGFIVLPPVTFRVTAVSGAVEEFRSEPVLLEVVNVQVNATRDIKDIKPLLQAPYTLRDFLPWILLAAAAGFLGTLIWFYIRNRRRNKPFIKLPARQPRPPHQIALELLDELKKDQLWQKGQIKEYYTRITDILREYFEKRFEVTAAEMTSDEIMAAMKDHITDVAILGDLRKLLTLSDLAKFAKGQPIGAENELSMTYARTVVMHTSTAPAAHDSGKGEGTDPETDPDSQKA